MVINNSGHTKRCDSRCESFNGFQAYCPHRSAIIESLSDYRFKMYRMRSDKSYHRTNTTLDGKVRHMIVQNGFPENYGKCNRDEIALRKEIVKPRKRVMTGGVL